MKDRFKFRAWNKHHKKMYDVYQIDFNCGLIFCDSAEGTTHTFGFIKTDLLQCTGLKDKNGTLIFEGDICTSGDKCRTSEIVFEEGSFRHKLKGGAHTSNVSKMWVDMFDIEITGNIHEEAANE